MVKRGHTAFTLIELLVAISIIGLLTTILLPSLGAVRRVTRKAVCSINLRGLFMGHVLYLEENHGVFFPYREVTSEGILWYWGLEMPPAPDGTRPIDKSKARLWPYFQHSRDIKVCPSVPRGQAYFAPKFDMPGYGYAINKQMLYTSKTDNMELIARPSATIAWADSAQIRTWMTPCPVLEEWYYLENATSSPATFHFRHSKKTCNAINADGSARTLTPYWLDDRLDKRVGRPEAPVRPPEISYLLRLDK